MLKKLVQIEFHEVVKVLSWRNDIATFQKHLDFEVVV